MVVLPATIDAAGVDLACFGHIHKPQRLSSTTPAYYCGSVNQLTFNDEGTAHGFWLHQLSDGNRSVVSEFQRTPERSHRTVTMKQQDVADFISSGTLNPGDVEGRVVRARYSCTLEQEKAFNRAELQKRLMDAGAFYVAEIIPDDVEALDAKDPAHGARRPRRVPVTLAGGQRHHRREAARLMELAAPIIKHADDGREDSKHAGAFMPKTIEVKNYRSYTEAGLRLLPGTHGDGERPERCRQVLPLHGRNRGLPLRADPERGHRRLGPRRDKERQYHLYLCPGRAGLPGHPHQDQERARHPGPTAVEPRGGRLGR